MADDNMVKTLTFCLRQRLCIGLEWCVWLLLGAWLLSRLWHEMLLPGGWHLLIKILWAWHLWIRHLLLWYPAQHQHNQMLSLWTEMHQTAQLHIIP